MIVARGDPDSRLDALERCLLLAFDLGFGLLGLMSATHGQQQPQRETHCTSQPRERCMFHGLPSTERPSGRKSEFSYSACIRGTACKRRCQARSGCSGKPFSNAELLSLQASMYRYTQELDLVGKVVEKATTGLKDVVKTQV